MPGTSTAGHSPWALPKLAADVPPKIVPSRLGAANAAISRFLLGARAFRETDLPAAFDDSLRACEQGLSAWIACEIGPLRCLRPRFHMQVIDGLGHVIDRHRMGGDGDNEEPPRYAGVEISWYEAQVQEWPIGPALEALEAAVPGLGATVLHVLHRQSPRAYPLFTPALARDMASWLYWYGEDDEETALDMQCGEDEAERETARAEMVSRDLLHDAYPGWARTWPVRAAAGKPGQKTAPASDRQPCWRTIDLRRALLLVTDPRQRALVIDAIALARIRIEDNGYRRDLDGEFIGFGAVLSWSENDITTRVFDDLIEQAQQSECHDRIGELRIALNAPEVLKQWQQAMRPRFKAIALIDRLICRLAG